MIFVTSTSLFVFDVFYNSSTISKELNAHTKTKWTYIPRPQFGDLCTWHNLYEPTSILYRFIHGNVDFILCCTLWLHRWVYNLGRYCNGILAEHFNSTFLRTRRVSTPAALTFVVISRELNAHPRKNNSALFFSQDYSYTQSFKLRSAPIAGKLYIDLTLDLYFWNNMYVTISEDLITQTVTN